MSLEERTTLLSEFKSVSQVVVNTGGLDSRPAIREVMPDFIVHGDDWTGEALMKQMNLTRDFLDQYGIEMLYVSNRNSLHTSDIIERCSQQS